MSKYLQINAYKHLVIQNITTQELKNVLYMDILNNIKIM